MIRRSFIAACALVGAISLSSCSTFSDNDAVARVDDVELTRADLEEYVNDAVTVANGGELPDQLTADVYRQIIGGWVVDELIRQKLGADGVEITDDDRAAAQTELDAALAGQTDVPESVIAFELESGATRQAFSRTQEQGALGEFAATVSVVIDPRYGYWDLTSGTILPMQP